MIAVDTNLLVYAHRADAEYHHEARGVLQRLAEGSERWGVPWPCVHEFIAVVTNPRIYKAPTPLATAFEAVLALDEWANLDFLGEGDGYLRQLESLATAARIQGGAIHDARIAAICLHHGVRELWSADRDFSRYTRLPVRNPLLG